MKNILFDLDGTLLPMDVEEFVNDYFHLIVEEMYKNGRDGKMIINAVIKGVTAIAKKDGTKTNEDVFWDVFASETNIKKEDIEAEFMHFYNTNFNKANKNIQSPNMIEAVKVLKEKGYALYLATNPLFPSIATEKRIEWAGLNKEDFKFITTYENSYYCKPNASYYQELVDKFNLDVNECLMVGNDVKEDGAAKEVGIDVYLVNDYLLNKYNLDINTKYCGSSLDFLEFVRILPEIK